MVLQAVLPFRVPNEHARRRRLKSRMADLFVDTSLQPWNKLRRTVVLCS